MYQSWCVSLAKWGMQSSMATSHHSGSLKFKNTNKLFSTLAVPVDIPLLANTWYSRFHFR